MIITRGMRIGQDHLEKLQRLSRLAKRPQYEMLNIAIDELYVRTQRTPRHRQALMTLEEEDAKEESEPSCSTRIAPRDPGNGQDEAKANVN